MGPKVAQQQQLPKFVSQKSAKPSLTNTPVTQASKGSKSQSNSNKAVKLPKITSPVVYKPKTPSLKKVATVAVEEKPQSQEIITAEDSTTPISTNTVQSAENELKLQSTVPQPDLASQQLKAEALPPKEEVPTAELNGMIKVIYERYDEEFPIVNGSTTQENIDEVYCLTFVMPGCHIHLSKYPPEEQRIKVINGDNDLYVSENPSGTYQDLRVGTTYYAYVEQEAERLRRDQEAMAKARSTKAVGQPILEKDDGRGMESCSCIYGNPCVVRITSYIFECSYMTIMPLLYHRTNTAAKIGQIDMQ